MSAPAARPRALLVKEAKVAESVVDYVLAPPPNGLGWRAAVTSPPFGPVKNIATAFKVTSWTSCRILKTTA
eukprot:6166640-Amphidinium_carterae.1